MKVETKLNTSLDKAINKAQKAGKKAGRIKRYPFPRNKLSHLRSEQILGKKIQTYSQNLAELLPLVLPFSVKKFENEQLPPQKDGTIVKIYHYIGPEYRLKLSYSLPHTLAERYFSSNARQQGSIDFPVLGKDLKPVTLALLNLSSVQKSPYIIFTLEDLANQIFFERADGWRRHLSDLILTIGTTSYDIYDLKGEPQISGSIGTIAFPGKTSARFGIKLQSGEVFFSFNHSWLLPYPNRFGKEPYFILATDELKGYRLLPDYMKNGYLWLASHRYSLNIITPKIGTFLRKGFGLSEEEIKDWQGHGRVRPKWKEFLIEMKTMGVLQRVEYLTEKSERGRNFVNCKVRFIPTKTFKEQAAIDILPDTEAYREAIRSYLESMATHKQNAKWVLEKLLLPCSSEMEKNIRSGKFDSMVKKGYYDRFK